VVAEQHRRAQRITRAATSYLQDYSVPLVAAARRDPASARTVAATDEGRRRVDAIRADFDGLMAVERGLAASRQDRSNAAARRAILATLGGLAGSVVLILVFTGYLTRAIVGPVRPAAVMAGRLAGGDLSVRMPERGWGKIGALERSFKSMAGALEDGRDQLGRLADEQAALRRVATLVAQRVPPVEVFATVAEEVGRLLGTEGAGIVRYEPDNTTTLVAGWSRDGDHMPVGSRFPIERHSLSDLVLRTGRPARIDRYADAPGAVAAVVGSSAPARR
jgi:HAMP domain-containing protein